MPVNEKGLEPCPFCGCEVELVSSKNAPERLLVIACKSPSPCIGSGLGGFYILESQREEGIAAWNRRHPSTGGEGGTHKLLNDDWGDHSCPVTYPCARLTNMVAKLTPIREAGRDASPEPSPASEDVVGDGWIEWKGGECPVEPDRDVYWQRRGEAGRPLADMEREFKPAADLRWSHLGRSTDIIAYRALSSKQRSDKE